jgi:hypothetical protein
MTKNRQLMESLRFCFIISFLSADATLLLAIH